MRLVGNYYFGPLGDSETRANVRNDEGHQQPTGRSWASEVAQCFIGEAGRSTQWPQEVTIQCPNREAVGTQRDDGDHMLQAVKFTDKKVPGSILTLT